MTNTERIACNIFSAMGQATLNGKEVFLLENGIVIDAAAETVGNWNFKRFQNNTASLNICGKIYKADIQKNSRLADIWEE